MITMFGLFAEIERDLLSERTKMGLANAKAKGKKLGRPVGRLGKHKLDGEEAEIAELLSYRVSKSAIARNSKFLGLVWWISFKSVVSYFIEFIEELDRTAMESDSHSLTQSVISVKPSSL